jgi:hypothetical protein
MARQPIAIFPGWFRVTVLLRFFNPIIHWSLTKTVAKAWTDGLSFDVWLMCA